MILSQYEADNSEPIPFISQNISDLWFIISEDDVKDRQMLWNALYHNNITNIDVASEGKEVYQSFSTNYNGANNSTKTHNAYNCMLISLNYQVNNSIIKTSNTNNTDSWDGFQAIRMIKQYEWEDYQQKYINIMS